MAAKKYSHVSHCHTRREFLREMYPENHGGRDVVINVVFFLKERRVKNVSLLFQLVLFFCANFASGCLREDRVF